MNNEISVTFFYLAVDLNSIPESQRNAAPFLFSKSEGWQVNDELAVFCAMDGAFMDAIVEPLLEAGLPEMGFSGGCEDGLNNMILPKINREETISRVGPWLRVRRTVDGSWIAKCLGEDVLVEGELEGWMYERASNFAAIRDLQGIRLTDHAFCHRPRDEETWLLSCPWIVKIQLDGVEVEALVEQWKWSGCYAQALIFHTKDVAEKSDADLRRMGIPYFGCTFDEKYLDDAGGRCGDGEAYATLSRGKDFVFVNVLAKDPREKWW